MENLDLNFWTLAKLPYPSLPNTPIPIHVSIAALCCWINLLIKHNIHEQFIKQANKPFKNLNIQTTLNRNRVTFPNYKKSQKKILQMKHQKLKWNVTSKVQKLSKVNTKRVK